MLVDRPVTEAVLDEAIQRGQVRHKSGLQVTSVTFVEPCLAVSFIDGSGVLLPVQHYPEFDEFEVEDFADLKVGFSGTALCHEGKDLQVSIAGMISASKPLMDMALRSLPRAMVAKAAPPKPRLRGPMAVRAGVRARPMSTD